MKSSVKTSGDLKERGDEAAKEIAVICKKYQVEIGAQMVYEPTGISCKPIIIDTKDASLS
jgi:hypothetical protein